MLSPLAENKEMGVIECAWGRRSLHKFFRSVVTSCGKLLRGVTEYLNKNGHLLVAPLGGLNSESF